MAGINDLIKVNFDIKVITSSPELWRKILIIGAKETGIPESFGTINNIEQYTKEIKSEQDLIDLNVNTSSILYKVFQTFQANGGDSLLIGLVKKIEEIPEGETDPVEREESYLEALNRIYNQNNKFYGVFPIYQDAKTDEEVLQINKDVATWCSSHLAFAKLQTRNADDLLQENTNDIGSYLKGKNNNSCYIDIDLSNEDNKFASIANFTKLIYATRGQYDLSWKGDFINYEVSQLTNEQENIADSKNISYYKLDDDDLNSYFFGKTPSELPASVKVDIDYATIILKQNLVSYFRNNDKVPNNYVTQINLEYSIKEVVKQMISEGVFEKTTRQDIADKYFSGNTSKVLGWDESLGCALYMPDITNPQNVVDGVYKGIMLYVRINGVVYGITLNARGVINI